MNDLPFAALILAITAILITSAGGFARLALAWHRNTCILQEGRERAAMVQNLAAAFIPIVAQIIAAPMSHRPHRHDGTIPMDDQDQDDRDEMPDDSPEVPYRPKAGPIGPQA